jgi:hypothetical protein
MGLTINKPIQTAFGNEISSGYYLRLYVELGHNGKQIGITAKDYASRAAFDSDAQSLGNMIQSMYFEYNRETDGADLLAFAHLKAKEHLISENIATEAEIQIEF